MTTKKHSDIIAKQKLIAEKYFANSKPSQVTDIYWLYASRKQGNYPKSTPNSGKWLIFVDIKNLDLVWEKIKAATENGLLGETSKVSTSKPNPNASKQNLKVICVYTYDYTDRADVVRIREELRRIGITNKIPYKTDTATLSEQYEVKGHKQISVYYE